MNRRNFIIAASGITTIGILKTKSSQPSIAFSEENINITNEVVPYGYRDDFELFDEIQINIDSLELETQNIDEPEKTKVSLQIENQDEDTIKKESDILKKEDKNEINESGSTIIEDVTISLDNLDKGDLSLNNNDEGETKFTLKFTIKHEDEDITRNASDSFKLDIFEITTIRKKLYNIIPEDDIPEVGNYDIIPEYDALEQSDSLIN